MYRDVLFSTWESIVAGMESRFILNFHNISLLFLLEKVAGNMHNASRNDFVKAIAVFCLLLIKMAIIMVHEISFRICQLTHG